MTGIVVAAPDHAAALPRINSSRPDSSSAAWRSTRSSKLPAAQQIHTPGWRTESTPRPSGSSACQQTSSPAENSSAKSRSLVASMLFAVGASMSTRAPWSRDPASSVAPATAPDPSGQTFSATAAIAQAIGIAQTASPHTPAASAPPVPVLRAADACTTASPHRHSARPAPAVRRTTSASSGRSSSMASRTNNRRSVAICSLRLRPV